MCNLYSMTKTVDTIRRLFGAMNSQVGNLPSLPASGSEIVLARWGMPSAQFTLMQSAKKRATKLEAKASVSISHSCCGQSRTAE